MIFHYNILIIKTIKHQSYYRENMYVFFQKYNHVFKDDKNTGKHVRVLGNK